MRGERYIHSIFGIFDGKRQTYDPKQPQTYSTTINDFIQVAFQYEFLLSLYYADIFLSNHLIAHHKFCYES